MQKPFELLADFDRRARMGAAGLPAQEELRSYWSGVAFILRGQRYVAPLDEVHEILHLPGAITPIPGTMPWVRGVANVRGRLLPLIDLGGFLNLEEASTLSGKRVLVLELGDIFCGLIVDGVLGMQHFEAETYNGSIPASVPESLRFCMAGSYLHKVGQHESEYLVLSLKALASNEKFLQVSPSIAVA
ncbi:chemotaxis protein CheW [Parendozoicomonas haliclonae]|uniref:Chemotaxis protein CheW n=1 Tax=Parendozoicomonas haliclonae TaxID=1960125 RepID=A0A1X7AJV1_9GAMM|nr:chemotaxis protein CheW [Parendozoicomonas haliclonae]SMA46097.1 Chemotaxis protein CheW [Parendozoicomonas haliclonae]